MGGNWGRGLFSLSVNLLLWKIKPLFSLPFQPPTVPNPDWIGLNATHPKGLPWDVVHFNFGLHDLETDGPHGRFATSPSNYTRNLMLIWQKLAATGTKPPPLGSFAHSS